MLSPARHCIAPHCPAPYPQPANHRFCQQCGSPLVLQGRYIPRSRLGEGGFANIYTVWDGQTQQEQVLKVLTYEDEVAVKLFTQEALVLRQLNHPGIPRVGTESFFTVKTPQQTVYCLVMEKIQGDTLEMILERDYPQGCSETLVRAWLRQVTDILKLLHHNGIIHRDIKPANLMCRADTGQIVLIDFGGAKQIDHRDRSTRVFSSGYSPPEQVVGRTVQPTVDIYALGRTLIHLLTGRYPGDLQENPDGQLLWQRPNLDVSGDLAQLLNAMIAPDVRDRPPTAAAIQRQLWGNHTTSSLPPILNPLKRFKSWFGQCPPYVKFGQLKSRLAQHISPSVTLNPYYQSVKQQLTHLWYHQRSTLKRSISPPQITPQLTAITTKVRQQRRQIRQHTGQLMRRGSRYTVMSVRMTGAQMLASSTGAIAGTLIGWAIHYSTWGQRLILDVLNPALANSLPGVSLALTPDIWLITLAGLGTGVGVAAQSGHLSQRPVPLTGLLGGMSYGIAWLIWAYCPGGIALRLMVWLVVAVGGMVLSLGLKRSRLIPYLGITLLGTSSMAWSALTASQYWLQVNAMLSLEDVVLTYGLCGLLALVMAFWLGMTHHVLLPLAQWLRQQLTPSP
ncbi:MAG: serine/threonine protein kinase [Spirulina sp. SIO3F2]|nr:serine/threonine protein kinase [Spirulina sp. SIO3F2]